MNSLFFFSFILLWLQWHALVSLLVSQPLFPLPRLLLKWRWHVHFPLSDPGSYLLWKYIKITLFLSPLSPAESSHPLCLLLLQTQVWCIPLQLQSLRAEFWSQSSHLGEFASSFLSASECYQRSQDWNPGQQDCQTAMAWKRKSSIIHFSISLYAQ